MGVGTQLLTPPGSRGNAVVDSLAARSNQDSDQTDTTWTDYKAAVAAGVANGRRIVTAPIIDPGTYAGNGSNIQGTVIGFANFLLRSSNHNFGPRAAQGPSAPPTSVLAAQTA